MTGRSMRPLPPDILSGQLCQLQPLLGRDEKSADGAFPVNTSPVITPGFAETPAVFLVGGCKIADTQSEASIFRTIPRWIAKSF